MLRAGADRLPSLLTWRLWRALRYPDEIHPLFQRLQAQSIQFPGRRLLLPFAETVGGLLRVAVITLVIVSMLTAATLGLRSSDRAALLFIPPAALVLVSNGFGALIAFNIMSTINHERERHTYDLLAVTPMGLGASNWLIAAACAYRLNAVDRMAQVRTLAVLVMILLIFISFEGTIFAPLTMLALLLTLNLDAIQSLTIGCLSGMLAQLFREKGAPFAALAIFAFAQIIAVYLPMTGLAILLFDALRRMIADTWLANSLIALVMLALLFLLREAIIQGMWRALERHLL
jgi:hypothetical protein